MSISITPLHPFFGAEIGNVDISKPISPAEFAAIHEAMGRYGVVVFRETRLDDESQVAFSRLFGELELAPRLFKKQGIERRFQLQELFDAGNLDNKGDILPADDRRRFFAKGNRLWHTDSSYNPRRSAYSMLLAHIVPPEGGDTEFADMRTGYDALPDSLKAEIEPLVAEHSMWYSRMLAGFPQPSEEEMKMKPPSQHRLVQIHAASGRKTLFIAAHASHIVGWPLERGRALLKELTERVTRPEFVYRHSWRVGDLVIWDNLCTMHRATPFDDFAYRRDLRRTTVYEAA